MRGSIIKVVSANKLFSSLILYFGRLVLDPHKFTVLRWKLDQGDQTLRLKYPLTSKSVVFDLGGYKGEWTELIYTKYGSKMYVFEPVPSFAAEITTKFIKYHKIHVFPFGLSDADKTTKFHIDANATSEFGTSTNLVSVKFRNIKNILKKEKIKHIDLMKINIEGGEYDLMEYLIQSNLVKLIDNIQVQFHVHVDNANVRIKKIHSHLAKTHTLTYQYPFVWENWKRKNVL